MRILLITQEIDENSALLGVILTWIRHLAPKVDHIAVLALSAGAAELPENVSVSSMGKERNASRLYLLRSFYRHLWRLLRRRDVDIVFVHMVPRYAILAAPLARLFGVPIVLWNAHGTVSRYLRLAHRLVAAVVTASPESFRINSPKRIVTGHGIDTDYFTARGKGHEDRRLETCATGAAAGGPVVGAEGPDAAADDRTLETCATETARGKEHKDRRLQTCATGAAAGGPVVGAEGPDAAADDRRLQTCATETARGKEYEDRRLQTCATEEDSKREGSSTPIGGSVLLTVGRLSRSKDYGTIIAALALLREHSPDCDISLRVIGTPFFADDHAYLAELKQTAHELGVDEHVNFVGKVPNRLMVEEYRRCDVLINASHTGSIDKVVLEAMACEKPAVTCNESFAPVLADHADLLMFAPSDAAELAERVAAVLALAADRRQELGRTLRRIVVNDHSVAGMTDRFVEVFARIAAKPSAATKAQ